MLNKYGVKRPAQLQKVQEKMKATCMNNFGVEWYLQSTESMKKREQLFLRVYGVDCISKSKKVKEKKKETFLKKFGVECPLQLDRVKKKSKETCLKKYGADNYFKSDIGRYKNSSRMKNGGAAYANSFVTNPSKSQVKLFNLTKEFYPDAVLNYPCLNYSIDISIPNLKIAIEYDGSYYHQDKEKDRERQLEIEQQGWKFIRYKDCVPVKDELLRDIKNLINDKTYL